MIQVPDQSVPVDSPIFRQFLYDLANLVGAQSTALSSFITQPSGTMLPFPSPPSSSSGATLTATDVGYGDAGNSLTGTADLTFVSATHTFTIGQQNTSIGTLVLANTNGASGAVTFTSTAASQLQITTLTGGSAGGGSTVLNSGSFTYQSIGSTRFFVDFTGASAGVSASNNVFFGWGAGRYAASGTNNSAYGANALAAATTASNSTACGAYALNTLQTGSNNTGIGMYALQLANGAADNTAVGHRALSNISTGNNNTAVGKDAFFNLASNSFGVAIGHSAGLTTTGGDNICIGYQSYFSATSGTFNIAIGEGSLGGVATGNGNVSIGYNTMSAITSGSTNTGIGKNHLTSLTSGSDNTACGVSAGSTMTTGSNNTFLGNNAQPSSAGVSNEITLGNSSVATLRCQQTSITALSDRRDKKNIEDLTLGIHFVMKLKPRRFTWNMRDGGRKDVDEAGFIAQELRDAGEAWLGLVLEENPDRLEASPGKLIPILVKAIQDLKNELEEMKRVR